jgi:hypothetical protein
MLRYACLIDIVLAGLVAWTGKRPDCWSIPLQLFAVAVVVASNQGGPKDWLKLVATGLFRVVQHGCQNVHFIDFLKVFDFS